MNENEILESLGITDPATQNDIIDGTKRLLILDASAHLDWDWILPFPVLLTGGSGQRAPSYFSTAPHKGPASSIFIEAASLLQQSKAYHYSICEIGFLRGFAMANPFEFKALMEAAISNKNLRIAGGGITSPDNLLPHGETFIRNFLIGHAWLAANCSELPPVKTLWIPDDFGHDPQLPILAQAMGFIAAGFARVPGTGREPNPISGGLSLAEIMTGTQDSPGKITFTWTASDGSSIIAQWLIKHYSQGNEAASASDIAVYLDDSNPPSPTPYIYVPVLNDFSMPNSHLVKIVDQWNQETHSKYANVIAANGSFEDYAQLAQFHAKHLEASYGPSFNANPFSTGCYGSKPEIKILHQRASRNLLAAEIFSVIAAWTNPLGGALVTRTGTARAQQLFDAWDMLVPSTHHDYITGTAIPDVFHTEQLTLLRQADAAADLLLRDTMETIAGAVDLGFEQSLAVVVFNSLGFQRKEVVELTAAQVANSSISVSGKSYQPTPDGGLLFMGSAPSLGYQTIYSGNADAPVNPAEVKQSTDKVLLSNGLLSTTLTPDAHGIWGLTSVVDTGIDKELIQPNRIANDLLFYPDIGDEYLFGNEYLKAKKSWQTADVTSKLSNPTIEIIENGPLRVRVKTKVTYRDVRTTIDYVREYILLANEPMLRMRSTGAAPMLPAGEDNGVNAAGCSVVVAFPLAAGDNGIDKLVRGTPYHWTDVMPDWIEPTQIYWNDQTFLPTHNFIIPQSGGESLCAFYHSDIPAWGISNVFNTVRNDFEPNDGVLYNCIWRNGDGRYFDTAAATPTRTPLAEGTDPDVHVREYALRIPSSLKTADTGGPLREALAFRSPLLGVVAAQWTGQLPDTLSLASGSPDSAIITAVKPGTVKPADFVFRIYQPTNAPLSITLTLDPRLNPLGTLDELQNMGARGQTALEQDLSEAAEAALNIETTSNTITFKAATALTTLAVTPRLIIVGLSSNQGPTQGDAGR